MWNSAEYCDVSLNWNSRHDPSFIVSYSTVQNGASNEWKSAIPELLPSNPSLHCTNSTSEETLFSPEVRSTCKPHNAVSILGVDVISEARILEVYSDLDGYLMSCKGESIDGRDGNENKIYNCRFTVKEPVTSITLKFLGLDDKTSFSIQRLHFALVQRASPAGGQGEMGIDLNKVKGYLHSMGDNVSENAQDLLSSVEKYQQSQMMGMSSLQSMLSGSRSHSGGQLGGIGQLTGLLSMFSKLSSVGMATKGQQNSADHHDNVEICKIGTEKNKQTKSDTHLQPDQSTNSEQINSKDLNDAKQKSESSLGNSLEHSDLDDRHFGEAKVSPLERLLRKPLPSQGHSGDEGQDDMYKMLQGICGSVSALRVKSQEEELEKSQEQTDSSHNGAELQVENLSTNSGITMPTDMHDLAKVIEQTVLQEVQGCEQRIKDYVDTSLATMETRMNAKLDRILELLERNCDKTSSDT